MTTQNPSAFEIAEASSKKERIKQVKIDGSGHDSDSNLHNLGEYSVSDYAKEHLSNVAELVNESPKAHIDLDSHDHPNSRADESSASKGSESDPEEVTLRTTIPYSFYVPQHMKAYVTAIFDPLANGNCDF
ncbi:hypothetical protein H4Q26_014985 [Puccinia striiformis f. sp. tritici PST-130]|nr:hypothetical protein H4Q26_014985 [Puccinia striiformis f. sp. tritici PST-130]